MDGKFSMDLFMFLLPKNFSGPEIKKISQCFHGTPRYANVKRFSFEFFQILSFFEKFCFLWGF